MTAQPWASTTRVMPSQETFPTARMSRPRTSTSPETTRSCLSQVTTVPPRMRMSTRGAAPPEIGEVLSCSLGSRMTTRVLVVDDSATIRKVVSAVLQRHGFEAIQAADGQSALELLTEAARAENGNGAAQIDLVLVDFVMPK